MMTLKAPTLKAPSPSDRPGLPNVDFRPLFWKVKTSTLKLLLMATRNPHSQPPGMDGALKPLVKEWDKSTNFPQLVSLITGFLVAIQQ